MQYVNTKEAREMLRVTAGTLRRWDKEGKIGVVRTPSGIRRYNKQDILSILCQNGNNTKRKKIAYCRVSSRKQNDDLKRQEDVLRSKYPDHEMVSDIGSGINFKRKGLRSILEQVMQGKIEEVVVSHKDRLCRFGFELIEWILNKNNTKLLVLSDSENKSTSEELAEDILAIVHVFSCKQMGRRRYKNDKTETKPDEEAKEDL